MPGPRPEPLTDVSAGHWLEERLWDWGPAVEGVRVGCVVPEGFAAYARILHPATRVLEEGGGKLGWASVAAVTGGSMHPEVQFERLARRAPHGVPGLQYGPEAGSLPKDETSRLVTILRPFTATPDLCWFAVWEGFGYGGEFDRYYQTMPRIQVPNRAYFLFRGSIETVHTFVWNGMSWQSPNIWWPYDRAWCVATEIDLDSTYVGGSEACIDQIVADPDLEVFRTKLDARVDFDGDTINV